MALQLATGDPHRIALEEVEHPPGRGAGRGGQGPARAGRHADRPDRQVGIGLGGPRVGRRRQRLDAGGTDPPGDAGDLGRPAGFVLQRQARDRLRPEHREVRRRHLAFRRQVEPDLEQLERIRRRRVEQRKHLGVDDALAGGQPLHVAAAEAGGRAERIGVVDQALADDRHGLEAAVRMAGEARHLAAVVHAPAVLAAEVLAEVAAGERRVGAEPGVALRIGVVVMDAEQERVDRLPGEAERLDPDDGLGGGGHGAPSQSQSDAGGPAAFNVRTRPGPPTLAAPLRKTRMSSTDARTALQLRSLVKKSGELEVSLAEVPVPEPGPGEVLVRLEAAPVNPSDLGLLFAAADMTKAVASGTRERPVVTAPIPEGAMKAHGAAGSTPRCRSATKAPAWSSPRALRRRRRRCSARPSPCSAARCTRSTAPLPAEQCLLAAGGRDAGRGRLLLRQPADRARHGRDDAARRPQRAGAHGGRLEPRPDAQPDLHRRRREAGQHRAQARAGGAAALDRRHLGLRRERAELPAAT